MTVSKRRLLLWGARYDARAYRKGRKPGVRRIARGYDRLPCGGCGGELAHRARCPRADR